MFLSLIQLIHIIHISFAVNDVSKIISDPKNYHIISWLPHGKGFSIHDKQRFATEILPYHFEGAKFTSFTRRLKRWNFERVSRGPEMGAYYSKFFIRGKPELVPRMIYGTEGEGGMNDDEATKITMEHNELVQHVENDQGGDPDDGDETTTNAGKGQKKQIRKKSKEELHDDAVVAAAMAAHRQKQRGGLRQQHSKESEEESNQEAEDKATLALAAGQQHHPPPLPPPQYHQSPPNGAMQASSSPGYPQQAPSTRRKRDQQFLRSQQWAAQQQQAEEEAAASSNKKQKLPDSQTPVAYNHEDSNQIAMSVGQSYLKGIEEKVTSEMNYHPLQQKVMSEMRNNPPPQQGAGFGGGAGPPANTNLQMNNHRFVANQGMIKKILKSSQTHEEIMRMAARDLRNMVGRSVSGGQQQQQPPPPPELEEKAEDEAEEGDEPKSSAV